jgi:hypothetical protein
MRLADIDDRKLTEVLKKIHDADGLLGTGFNEQQLANLVMITRHSSEIKDLDKAEEWVGMPGYDERIEGTHSYILTISFASEAERLEFIKKYPIQITTRIGKTWSTTWPYQGRNDMASIEFG